MAQKEHGMTLPRDERKYIDRLLEEIDERAKKEEADGAIRAFTGKEELPAGVLNLPAHPGNPWRGMTEEEIADLRHRLDGTENE